MEHSHTIKTVPNVEDAQDIQVLDARSTEETLDSLQVVLNPPVQAVLPDTIINPETKGISFGNCF